MRLTPCLLLAGALDFGRSESQLANVESIVVETHPLAMPLRMQTRFSQLGAGAARKPGCKITPELEDMPPHFWYAYVDVKLTREKRTCGRLPGSRKTCRPAILAGPIPWANVPPGTRTSLYANPDYQSVPFAKMTLDSINSADPIAPSVQPVPYVGVQFVAIPEFAGVATTVGEIFSAALAGSKTADEALAEAQTAVADEMKAAGYIQ